MGSSYYAYACASELRAKLVVSSGDDAFLGAIDVEGRDWWMVGSLLGNVGDGDGLVVTSDAVSAARGRGARSFEGWMGIFNLPVALRLSELL